MNDPFDVLHHPPAFVRVRAVPDESFRARVLGDVRVRLEHGDRWSSDLEQTSISVESIVMPGTSSSHTRRNPLLLAAASVVLLALGVTGIIALTGGDDGAPQPVDVGRAGDVAGQDESSRATTLAPGSTAGTITTSTTPTTVPRASTGTSAPSTSAETAATASSRGPEINDEAAKPLLLSAEEYGRGWTRTPAPRSLSAAVDPGVARTVPECSAFLDTVFLPVDDARHANVLFNLAYPEAAFTQYSVLFDDPDTARTVFDEVNSSGFIPCSQGYARATAGSNCCDGAPWFPSPVHEPITAAPFDTTGLTLAYRRFEASWTDAAGTVHGPEVLVDVVLLHDRSLTFFGTLAVDEDGGAVQSDADVERSVRAALVRMEAVTGVASTISPASGAPFATAIDAETLGDGWTELIATAYRDVDFAPDVLSRQCEPFVADVYDVLAAAPTANRVFTSPPPLIEFAQHHVTVVASTDVARIAFTELTSPEFTECARTQVRMFEALKSPTVVEGPSTAGADDIVWFSYDRRLSDDVTRDFVAVVARVGRVVFYLDTFTGLNGDESVMDMAEFEAVVRTAVSLARDTAG